VVIVAFLQCGGEPVERHAEIDRRLIDAGDSDRASLPGLGRVNDVHDYLPIQLTDILLRLVTKADLIRRDARPARDCRCKPSSTGRSPHGIKLTACERTTSENYLSILPMMLAKRCCLVDNMTLRSQLAALERRVGAGDRETISHPQPPARTTTWPAPPAGPWFSPLPIRKAGSRPGVPRSTTEMTPTAHVLGAP
jgi:hypothetical protein